MRGFIMSREVILHHCGALLGSWLDPFGTLLLHVDVQKRPWVCPAKVTKVR